MERSMSLTATCKNREVDPVPTVNAERHRHRQVLRVGCVRRATPT